ncbi:hypothetical protein L3Q82_009520 [Scortum barcoo]|uniref:Uncharacterized protein n=1 Tax=Scortum barcoo TaxID=214431 RepID=A0ACB8WGG9_9TELE|nr:hypothetical protein L3Q82_009520 [Scortum barcoo]
MGDPAQDRAAELYLTPPEKKKEKEKKKTLTHLTNSPPLPPSRSLELVLVQKYHIPVVLMGELEESGEERTFGSGVIQPFNGSIFYVRSNCPFTLTRFTHNRVECDITVRRGDSGLLVEVEIIINKIRTVLHNGSIEVEKESVSLPYDHTYQHIFHYGIYTKLRSSLIPLSVTWHSVPGGIDTVWVKLEQELSSDMSGLCGKHNVQGNKQQLISESVLADDTCQIRDPTSTINIMCRQFFSHTLDCLQAQTLHYIQLCEENIYSYEKSRYVGCAFFKEVVRQCGNNSYAWRIWRTVTSCEKPSCPGDLNYVEQGPAFIPTCSNPNPRFSDQDYTSTCVCPADMVLNDRADGFHCVHVSKCPCVFAGRTYSTGDVRQTKCQSCMCNTAEWKCSENICPNRCLIEGQFVTTYDGKQYVVPNRYNILVFWQSSMYVQVHTSFGLRIQVQMAPEIQVYITQPKNHTGMVSGLCGNANNDTTDDFTTSSGIIENSAEPFALSWSMVGCFPGSNPCINTDNEIFADEKCSVLNDPTGIFAECHGHIPTDHYHMACLQRTCNCDSPLQQCLCVALGNYAKACASVGVAVGDWRKATNCTLKCQKNQEFSYNMQACNHTCRSLSGPDPRCQLDDAAVEGCGCLEGTHLNQEQICTPKAQCQCHYNGDTIPPGTTVIDGRKCVCENGELRCSKDCGCKNGTVCVHCSENQINTAQKTCDSLSKPMGTNITCESGCYCPEGQYEDHRGNCVPLDRCSCVYSGKVFSPGEHVRTNCKLCLCGNGQWHCKDEPCPGKCQVYGNGHYQTFDSKWYRFNGHCQYTLVEDDCGNRNGTFSVRVESVPCCDEALTCSRSIIFDLQGSVTLTLSDMRVTRRHHDGWTLQADPLYSTHTVGLYIIISVPSKGITLIWDKHTRITIELHSHWRNRVCGLCGNFDSNEMNDLQIRGSAMVSSPLAFGNSWKGTTPPCSDVISDGIFPCERNSYCSAWAQRRCMILTGDTFKDCHLKVDPKPYYHACVQESCSSVYCDYYNEQGQCSWHYEACGKMQTCSKGNYLPHKLEGKQTFSSVLFKYNSCYPRCSESVPYYDENTGKCTKLRNCTCYFNDTIILPGTKVMIESVKCYCENGTIKCRRCDLYGDPHYISFQGVTFDFLDDCTYILVEERSPLHNLTIAVDNFDCVSGLEGSCTKGLILKYQNNIAALTIIPDLFAVQASLNNVTVEPPYEEHGWRFETTGYIVSIFLPEIRSYVSLSPSYTVVVSLAMEHFFNNTQGQCGVCGSGSCIRRGGEIEDDSCCDKTAYDWVYPDPLKPACSFAPKDVPCHPKTTIEPTITSTSTTSCSASLLCEVLDHPVFLNCSRYMDLSFKKRSCKFDACRSGPCSSLEQAAEECTKAGFCVDWRNLTNGACDVPCPKGLIYSECSKKMDYFCYRGALYPKSSIQNNSPGCYCPSGLFRADNHSNICVPDCFNCKGPLGEIKLPGEVWNSTDCNVCTCNNITRTEQCFPKAPKPAPLCSPTAVLVSTSCPCSDQICVEKTCSYNGEIYKMGDRWKDVAHPCMSFSCSKEGIQTETKVCPGENCQEVLHTPCSVPSPHNSNQSCSPKVTNVSLIVGNCSTTMQLPVCQGQCVSEPRVVLSADLQVEQTYRCCQEQNSERRSVTLQCSDLTARQYVYKHITGCECRA